MAVIAMMVITTTMILNSNILNDMIELQYGLIIAMIVLI